jgi:hypothetical protein
MFLRLFTILSLFVVAANAKPVEDGSSFDGEYKLVGENKACGYTKQAHVKPGYFFVSGSIDGVQFEAEVNDFRGGMIVPFDLKVISRNAPIDMSKPFLYENGKYLSESEIQYEEMIRLDEKSEIVRSSYRLRINSAGDLELRITSSIPAKNAVCHFKNLN